MGKGKFFTFGKEGQSVTPNWAREVTREDGKTDVYYGNKGETSHGHSVRGSDGSIEYSRSIGGDVRTDK